MLDTKINTVEIFISEISSFQSTDNNSLAL